MSIRLRMIEGRLVALCGARSTESPGDVYLDDDAHYALMQKFAADFGAQGVGVSASAEYARLMEIGESDNPAREEWEREYAHVETTP